MDLYGGLLVGVLQGLLEWLPLSSSGQGMVVLTRFFGLDAVSAINFMFILHFGTMLAAVVKFRGDFKTLAADARSLKFTPLLRFMAVATFFSLASGGVMYLLMLKSLEEAGSDFAMLLVGVFLVVTGVVLFLSRKSYGSGGLETLSVKDTVVVGLAQGFAVLPGLSRSGVTVASLLLSDVRQEEALRLSFLMSVPVVFAATLGGLYENINMPMAPAVAGIVAAFIVGYVTISGLMYLSRRVRFDLFCLAYGILAVLGVVFSYL